MKYIPLRPSSSKRSGGSLTASDFIFDPVELEKAVKSPKAKVLLLNTPHNPLGKVCHCYIYIYSYVYLYMDICMCVYRRTYIHDVYYVLLFGIC